MKSWRMKWVVHLACMRGMKSVCKILIGKPDRRKSLGDQGEDMRTILNLIL
jgi:hypothetical protein